METGSAMNITIVKVPKGRGHKKIRQQLTLILTELHRMSAELDAVNAKLTELETALATAQATTDAKQDAIAAAIATLQDMIANQAATPADLVALQARLQTALDATNVLTQDIADTPEG